MKPLLLVLGVGVAALAMAAPASGQNYPWCSNFHDGGGTNCGFSTYRQCMATAQGSGGSCSKNNAYAPSAGRALPRRPARKRWPGANS